MAREHGYASWTELKAEAARRRAVKPPSGVTTPPSTDPGAPRVLGDRYSFGGGPAIDVTDGVLSPRPLLVEPGSAVLTATLTMSGSAALPLGRRPQAVLDRLRRRRIAIPRPALADLALVDDRGTSCAVAVRITPAVMPAGPSRTPRAGTPRAGTTQLEVAVEPPPDRTVNWLELRDARGTASRLLPSVPASAARVRVGPVGAISQDRPDREMVEDAISLLRLRLLAPGRAGATPTRAALTHGARR